MTSRAELCLCLGLVAALWGSPVRGVAADGVGASIPPVHGISFTDQVVDLPKDLQGRVGVLVVGFSQGSRDRVTVWGKRLAVDYYGSDTVRYYEMPVLAGVPRLIRGYVVGKIKASVSDRAKPHFVPVLENETAWRTAAGYKDAEDAYVLVVDGAGVVRWQTHGALTEASYSAMRQQVEALRGGGGH